MTRTIPLVLFGLLLGACAKEPATTAELARHGPDGVAIDGYSAVSYFTKGAAEKGSPEFTVSFDGLRNWESKFEDAAGERGLLAKADDAWGKLLSGRRSEKVVFFNPADEARVSEARRAAGKKMYE